MRAGAAKAGLHLVDAEEGAVAAAEPLRAGQVAGLGQHDALALDGLGQEEGDVFAAQLGLERCEVVEGHQGDVGEERLEGRPGRGAAVHRERAEREAVEAVLDGHDARPACGGPPDLDGRLDGLGAAVDEQDAIGRGGATRRSASASRPGRSDRPSCGRLGVSRASAPRGRGARRGCCAPRCTCRSRRASRGSGSRGGRRGRRPRRAPSGGRSRGS